MMKKSFLVLLVCLGLIACGEDVEPLKPLQKGALNSITLSNGEVVYNLDGEWNCVYQLTLGEEEPKDIIKISQDGNTFVGTYTNGHRYMGAGTEAIKGELEKNGFKSLSANTMHGWKPASGKIGEKCNEIVIKASIDMAWENLIITLTRK